MRFGDIIFFTAEGFLANANVLAQRAKSKQSGPWSHVAVCVEGPLIVHAMPNGGVRFHVLREETLDNRRYVVARPKISSQDADKFELEFVDSCIYWIGEHYKIFDIYRSYYKSDEVLVGKSFCSYLVQKIYNRLAIEPFVSLVHPMLPVELYEVLLHHARWEVIENVGLFSQREDVADIDDRILTQDVPTLHSFYLRMFKLNMQATTNMLAGQLRLGIEGLNVAADLAAMNPHNTPNENHKIVLEIYAPLKDIMGYEPNIFLFYKNMLPILLSNPNEWSPQGSRTWLFHNVGLEDFDPDKAVHDGLKLETLVLDFCGKIFLEKTDDFLNSSDAEKSAKAEEIIDSMRKLFDDIGATAVFDSPLFQTIDKLSYDLEIVKNCNIEKWSNERYRLAMIIEGKKKILKTIDRLLALT
jgi:hypothetical protein